MFFAVPVIAILAANALTAQVSTEFSDIKQVEANYVDITASAGHSATVVDEDDIVEIPIDSKQKDLDDGYTLIPIGFNFDFNGETFTHLYVNVNGFVTFGRVEDGRITPPPYLTERVREPEVAFFEDDNSFPVNVIAPFWGDHYYRNEESSFNEYIESEIAYSTEIIDTANGYHCLTVQWKNLNINYKDENDGRPIKSSIANFQVKIYQSTKPYSKQGDIEFCYGQIGGNYKVEDTRVITKGAAVGLKGFKQAQGEGADYLNGLSYEVDRDEFNVILHASENENMSNEWTPSGATNARIRFIAFGKSKEGDWWGDGDVDFSKVEGGRHYQFNDGTIESQNRWVTANDARVIMESIATEIPLEPTIERAAYHGDVTHNGRYFFNNDGEKVKIEWRSQFYDDDLDNDVTKEISNPKQQIYFEVTAFDAATILNFLAAKLPELPWLLDMEAKGKIVTDETANDIVLGEASKLSENLVQFPVYLNGNLNGALAIDFKVNGTVESIVENSDVEMLTAKGENKVVVAASGRFDTENPVCYVNVRTNNNVIECSDINMNDSRLSDKALKLAGEGAGEGSLTVLPNPVSSTATVNFNIAVEGNYNISLYDITGRKVSNLKEGRFNTGFNTIDLDASSFENGVYILKVEGNNSVQTTKVIVK